MSLDHSLLACVAASISFAAGCGGSAYVELPYLTPRHPYTPSADTQLGPPRDPLTWYRLRDIAARDPVLAQSLETFRTAERVEDRLAGNGTIGEQYLAGRVLLDRADAPEFVAWIALRATLEGRIALLNVIACTHPNAAPRLREALLRDSGTQIVAYISGCLGDHVTVASLLTEPPVCGEPPRWAGDAAP